MQKDSGRFVGVSKHSRVVLGATKDFGVEGTSASSDGKLGYARAVNAQRNGGGGGDGIVRNSLP